jgi:glyoxalase family protein
MVVAILGLHHVTSTVGGAQEDVDFHAGALGLRLIKKTVNFDNPSVYHFYYGDELGTPGTLTTTFPYAGKGVRYGTKGAGQITAITYSVPRGSLEEWRRELGERGVSHRPTKSRFGSDVLLTGDPSGLVMELIEADDDARAPWSGGGPGPHASIRGIHSVTLTVRDPEPTLALLTDVLGYQIVQQEANRTRVAIRNDTPGHYLEVVGAPNAPEAVNGLGTVHHVAMAIGGADEQLAAREELVRHALSVTPVRDRQYFRSIYFREPGGVLFEIATLQPGFAIDEEPAELGTHLRLPSWEEGSRDAIEASLPRITPPAASRR